ncbi:hypothetical protein [Rhizobium redzepovicii]
MERGIIFADEAADEISRRLEQHPWFVAIATTLSDTVVIVLKSRKRGLAREFRAFQPIWRGRKVSVEAVDDFAVWSQ